MNIGILGAGTWGIALASCLSSVGHSISVWSPLEAEVAQLTKTREHPNLSGVLIDQSIQVTGNLAKAVQDKDMLLFAVPSLYIRDTARKVGPYITGGPLIVDAAKGLEPHTMLTMTEVISEELGALAVPPVALSGPTHAEEVARDMPTSIVSACADLNTAKAVQHTFDGTCLRVYTNTDVRGVEICGALKNIVALATGISVGLGFGDNTRAAIITRGITEIARLGIKMGCREQTFSGLAGIGDLIVTATSMHSRNNRAGQLIGQGYSAKDACEKVGMVVEGLNALPAAMQLAKHYGVELPIIEAVDSVVNHGAAPLDMVHHLMSRTAKEE